jgi:hypothetical protein
MHADQVQHTVRVAIVTDASFIVVLPSSLASSSLPASSSDALGQMLIALRWGSLHVACQHSTGTEVRQRRTLATTYSQQVVQYPCTVYHTCIAGSQPHVNLRWVMQHMGGQQSD